MTQEKDLSVANYNLVSVLQSSLYPNAHDNSVRLVLDYCAAARLDPMLKPVHIVPMYDSKSKQMRDVIMSGIGLYRIQASRSGECAGISEPIFGDDVSITLSNGATFTYPSFCKVTVKRRLDDGTIAEYTSVERWMENYATKSRNETDPNAMWFRRPYAQLAKCSEAQALRKAFPEIGAAPTAEEMEGKEFDMPIVVNPEPTVLTLPEYPQDRFDVKLPSFKDGIESGKTTAQATIDFLSSKYLLSDDQVATIKSIKSPQQQEG